MTSSSLDEWVGAEVFCKCENLQRAGAFKFRGATNAVRSLRDEEAAHGVATHSSGNHGAALALAARERGLPAFVVVPSNVTRPKRAAIEAYGATLVECAGTMAARWAMLEEVVAATGATVVHPFDDDRVIAGAGTAVLELLEQVGPLDVIMAPVGGGGLCSGSAIAAHGIDPNLRVVGAEPAGADDAARSLVAGRLLPQDSPDTIADGLRTSLSQRTFDVLSSHLERIVTVDDDSTVEAMRYVWERMKLVIEPSAAVVVAAARVARLDGARVGIVLSGGNVDVDALPW
ncbi:MAG: threonine dehydratase [Actinomycetota bacterium]|nr:threonine dehydratase [Actinomycetota bacterium]